MGEEQLITLTAKIEDTFANEHPFVLGTSKLDGSASLGDSIHLDIQIDRQNILDLECGIDERSDNTQPSWGIISNKASLSFNDPFGVFKEKAEKRILRSGAKCVIILNNTIAKIQKIVGTYIVEDWNYDSENKEVSASLTDGLESWQDIQYSGFPPIKNRSGTVYDIGSTLRASDIIFNGFGDLVKPLSAISTENGIVVSATEQARNILFNTLINFSTMEKSSLWGAFEKICQICGLYIIVDENRNAIIRTEFGY